MNPLRKIAIGGALVGATLTGGALGASLFGTANAATAANPSTTATAPSTGSAPAATSNRPAMPAHGSSDHEGQEKAVTGSAATQAQQAAVASVGSGTAGAVTSDFTQTGYEVTVTKADGSQVEVHLDSAFKVKQGPGGGHHGPDGDADDQPATASPSQG